MKGFFSGKGFRVLTAVVCVFLVLALVSAGNSSVNNFFTSFIFTPLQQVTANGSEAAGDALSPGKSNEELQKRVSELEEENRDLNSKIVDYYDVKKENEELKRFYHIKKENTDFTLVPSTVIGRDPNENFYGFTADKGSTDGISVNDPVITENGLVGWVSETAPKSCKVTTILSPDTRIGAVVKKTDDSGIVAGSAQQADDNRVSMLNLTEQHTAQKGDIVVTSGFGGLYPKNLRIGKISSIAIDEYSGMPQAQIKPFEDVRYVSSVVIITDFDGKGEINAVESSESEN